MTDATIRARWDGKTFTPSPGYARATCSVYPVGETVTLEISRVRSGRSHRHLFAELDEAWANLPESLQEMPWAINPHTFRKHLLIACGYADVRTVVTGNRTEAARLASLLTHLATEAHGYALADVRDCVVTLRTPWSMSYRAMGQKQFQATKTALLDAAAAMLETTADQITVAA